MDAGALPVSRSVNMHPVDRAASGVIGATLLAAGVRRGGWPGALVAVAGAGMLYRGVSGNCPGYTALGISTTSAGGPEGPGARDDAPVVERWITVAASPATLDALLRRPGVIGEMMGHFAEVSVEGDRMQWRIAGPFGRGLEWEARIVEHRAGERLSWMSEPGAALRSEGTLGLREASAGRGTIVSLALAWSPPGGAIGSAAMKLMKLVPEAVALRALQRLKSLAETGEIATAEHDPSGRRPAQRSLPPARAPQLAGSAA